MRFNRNALAIWLAVGAVGFLCVPWYALDASVLSTAWLRDFTGKGNAPALLQAWQHGRAWLLPCGVLLLGSAGLLSPRLDRSLRAYALLILGATGFLYTLGQGFAIGAQGWSFDTLARTLAQVEIPLGILTAVIGTPFFIWLLASVQKTWS